MGSHLSKGRVFLPLPPSLFKLSFLEPHREGDSFHYENFIDDIIPVFCRWCIWFYWDYFMCKYLGPRKSFFFFWGKRLQRKRHLFGTWNFHDGINTETCVPVQKQRAQNVMQLQASWSFTSFCKIKMQQNKQFDQSAASINHKRGWGGGGGGERECKSCHP